MAESDTTDRLTLSLSLGPDLKVGLGACPREVEGGYGSPWGHSTSELGHTAGSHLGTLPLVYSAKIRPHPTASRPVP